ncbi:MAG: hypothetical protein LC749_16070 [Actinobacteria bacterium]|nr:hypothetical protein [Actinomycetota bacterium]
MYDTKGAERVSWFQPDPKVSLELIDGLHLDRAHRSSTSAVAHPRWSIGCLSVVTLT